MPRRATPPKYEQYLDNPVKQIKKPSSQTHWVLNLLIYGILLQTKLKVVSSAQRLVSILYFQDHFTIISGSFRRPGSPGKLGSHRAPHKPCPRRVTPQLKLQGGSDMKDFTWSGTAVQIAT